MWCACNRHQDGVAKIDGRLYFFLYDLARDSFQKHGQEAMDNMDKQWAMLLEENSAKENGCFNTNRLVGTAPWSTADGGGPCHIMDCMQYFNCSDCK